VKKSCEENNPDQIPLRIFDRNGNSPLFPLSLVPVVILPDIFPAQVFIA
jgi:hypothetical protein